MSIDKFFVRDVTILHPSLVASYGAGTIPDHDAPTGTTRVRGWLHQLDESEQQSATRDAEVSTHILRLPVGTPIAFHDQVRVDGQLFNVDGPPARVWRPGGEHHIRVSLRYVDG